MQASQLIKLLEQEIKKNGNFNILGFDSNLNTSSADLYKVGNWYWVTGPGWEDFGEVELDDN